MARKASLFLPPPAYRAVAFLVLFLALVVPRSGHSTPHAITFDDFIALGRVSDPRISPDGKKVAFVVTYYDKDANEGNSDIYLVSVEGGEVKQLTNSPEDDSQPRFSPDGGFLAFTSSRSGKSQIWLLPLSGGEARQVTDLSTGASGPVWMPDGEHILFTSRVFPDCPDDSCNAARLDEQGKSKVKARVITNLLYRHWDHWVGERRRHVFMTSIQGGDHVDLTPGRFDVPTTALGSGHDYAVSPDGKELAVVANTDPVPAVSTNNDIFIISLEEAARGGSSAFPDGWKRFTPNPANDNYPVYSPDGRFLAYRAMDRPGFESDRYRLKVYDRRRERFLEVGRDLADEFDRSVRSITWAPDGKKIYVTCQDEAYVSVYLVDINSKRTRRLTSGMYISSLSVAPRGKRCAFLEQSAAMPYEVFTADRSLRPKSFRNVSRINSGKLAELDMNPLEGFTFAGAGGTEVHGYLLKPPGFEAGRKYPMIFLIHGGPQGAWSDSFHWRWNYQMFASPGYVVVTINPRGSTGYGQAFTDEISRDWGGQVFEDLVKGEAFVLEKYGDIIDADRIAAAGASFGGYMINWIEGHMEDFKVPFKCLVNHDGVYNLTSMYGATEELWFPEWDLGGTPWENPKAYEKFSPHSYANKFHTPMLIVHGGRDYRVPLAEGLQVFTALKRQGVAAKLLYFPDEGHWVQKPLNAELWWKTVLSWIDEWLE